MGERTLHRGLSILLLLCGATPSVAAHSWNVDLAVQRPSVADTDNENDKLLMDRLVDDAVVADAYSS